MQIIEQAVVGKAFDESLCEDRIFISEDFIAVIDGATSKGKLRWNGFSAGHYASTVLAAVLAELSPLVSGTEAILTLNRALSQAGSRYHELLAADHFERLMASIVIYSIARRQVWSFGDCQYLVNGRYYSEEKKIDTLLAQARSFVLEAELAAGKNPDSLRERDPGRELILPFLKLQSQFANRGETWRYAVLDGSF